MIERINSNEVERFNRSRIEAALGRSVRPLGIQRFGRSEENLNRRCKNPMVGNILEVVNWIQYDSVSFGQSAAFAKTTLFQTPIGQAGKTLADTNMTQAGQLQSPQKLDILALRFYVSNTTAQVDVQNILQNVSFQFYIGTKPMWQGPCLFLTAGCGILQPSAAFSTSGLGLAGAGYGASSTSVGVPDQRSVYSLTQVLTVESTEAFSVVLTPEHAFNMATTILLGVGTTIYVGLDGELYRGVQ